MAGGLRGYLAAHAFGAARVLVLALCAALLAVILILNGGKFTYTLDDPYIHLSVAEMIGRGGYGVNVGEYAAPSSSVLFPFLLLAGVATPLHEYLPLAWNLAALFLTVEILRAFMMRLGFGRDPGSMAIAATLVTACAIAFNLLGLVFSGMEHNLHIALTAGTVLGLIVFLEDRRATWWFLACLVLAPLIRYESLALTLPVVLCMALHGSWRTALALAILTVGLLAAFSVFLVTHGLPVLPSSVLAKSSQMASAADGALLSLLWRLPIEFLKKLSQPAALLLCLSAIVGALVLWGDYRRRLVRNDTYIAFVLMVLALGHNAAGQYGWFGRYEVYALMAMVMLLGYLAREKIREALATPSLRAPLTAGGLAALLAIGAPYLLVTFSVPLAANNIFEQQYQVHRFLVEDYRQPVAVFDLGWSTYRNDSYVFDLGGLGSEESRRTFPRNDLAQLNRFIQKRRIRLAILNRAWFANMPADWECVGALSLSRTRVTPDTSTVEFCTTGPGYAEALRDDLRAFQRRLPPRIRLEIRPPPAS